MCPYILPCFCHLQVPRTVSIKKRHKDSVYIGYLILLYLHVYAYINKKGPDKRLYCIIVIHFFQSKWNSSVRFVMLCRTVGFFLNSNMGFFCRSRIKVNNNALCSWNNLDHLKLDHLTVYFLVIQINFAVWKVAS